LADRSPVVRYRLPVVADRQPVDRRPVDRPVHFLVPVRLRPTGSYL